jgi:putative endonuclease
MKEYYIYIMASFSGVLYIGMTNNLIRRVYEHQNELIDGFSKKYKCKKLIYFESSTDVNSIIAREKQIKKWSRIKKLNLIKMKNPDMKDLSAKFTLSD